MPVPDKPSKHPTEVRQAGLVAAALQQAATRSPADITTADLAQAVGITQGAVFRHFSSKDAIWLGVMEWTSDNLLAALQRATSADGQPLPPLVALMALFDAHVNFLVKYPGVPRVIFQELQHAHDTPLKASVRSLMQQYRTLVMGLLVRAQEHRLLAPGVDLQAAAVLFLGSVQGLVLQSLFSGQVHTMATQAPGVFDIYLRGIAAHPISRAATLHESESTS
jgi:TetR/AcrR family transcriptional regulator